MEATGDGSVVPFVGLDVDDISELQTVKCVVVGDTGVGKTRLICARSCQRRYSMTELMQTHVPTVWAIDQYRRNSEVRNCSWRVVDGVSVSLRLWDTFGDHDKNRRFAYGRADVVVVCFNVTQPRSLRSVRKHWLTEIQTFCPGVPVILCGCQVDLRHHYNDPDFIALDKGPFFREIHADDILLPEAGRGVASRLGASYYETSVYNQFGVEELFMNVLRAALVGKRNRHFWLALGSLKSICGPMWQAPYCHPKPKAPVTSTAPSEEDVDLSSAIDCAEFTDILFDINGTSIVAHSACLAVGSPMFCDLLSLAWLGEGTYSSIRCCEVVSVADASAELPSAINRSINLNCGVVEVLRLDHPVFRLIVRPGSSTSLRPVVVVDSGVSVCAFNILLRYVYTGEVAPDLAPDVYADVHNLAESLGMTDLSGSVANQSSNASFLNLEIHKNYMNERRARTRSLLLARGSYSDVKFELDDGNVCAHRIFLIVRCEVMASMFSSNFVEKSAKMIRFPGVKCDTFRALLDYLYTGEYQPSSCCIVDCGFVTRSLELIEFANRLCQPEFVEVIESTIIDKLNDAATANQDIIDAVLTFLEPAQWYNANQLAEWCLWFLSINYNTIYKLHSKILHQLQPDNQIYLTQHQWPPLWYHKEVELYEKNVIDTQRACRTKVWSCVCFSSNTSSMSSDDSHIAYSRKPRLFPHALFSIPTLR